MKNPLMLIPFVCVILVAPARADDTEKITALFAAAAEHGGIVTIPQGDYEMAGEEPIALQSNTTVFAHGARFHFPGELPEKARRILFAGADVSHFAWHGGEFLGHVFDPVAQENHWEPNVNTKGIEITTTKEGGTHDLLFRDVKSNGVAGAVIGVFGLAGKPADSPVEAYAERVAVEGCTLLRSGKFMWDYGYLWQIMTWPEDYEPREVERARRYFRTDLMHSVKISDGDDRVMVESGNTIPVSETDEPKEALSFLGGDLPRNLVRGKQYFVVESGEGFVKIADTPGGSAIRFEGGSGPGLSFVHNIHWAYLSAYAPIGHGPGKGAFDIVGAKDVRVTGSQFSALGDTMHIQRCENIVFANNHIIGSRMGAFFLAEYCRNATVTGNLVDGTNGSRVMSVEKSCTDVTIMGNTFRNGGRGSWINQPVNFIMTGNVFVNNTTKNEDNPRRGRIAYQSALPGAFPELYVTIYEPDATYGPVIIRDNIFHPGDSAPTEVVTFAPNGNDIQFTGNTFRGKPVHVVVDPTCTRIRVQENSGAETVIKPVDFNHGRR